MVAIRYSDAMVVVRAQKPTLTTAQPLHGQPNHVCSETCAALPPPARAVGGEAEASSRQTLQQALRQTGLRSTPARIAVLAALQRARAPLSHAEMGELLEGELWDRATLYRNLTDLVKAGLARRVDLGDHIWRFEATSPSHTATAHPHFVCTACGTVSCVAGVELVLAPDAVASPLLTQQLEVQLKGLCDGCR